MISDFETIRALEESLWREETRFDAAYMDRLLAVDFFEFGRSGRIYTRAEILEAESSQISCTLPLKNFRVHPLSETIILTTYVNEVLYEKLEFANRSSIWVRSPTGWQIRFHQGTPFTPA